MVLPLATTALALLLRLATFAPAYSGDPGYVMAPDSHEYDRLARTLLVTGRFDEATRDVHTSRTPGYPIFVAGVYGIAGTSALAVVMAQIALSALTVLAVHLLARKLWTPAAGVLAGTLLACDAPSIAASYRILTETLFTFLLLAAVVVALHHLTLDSHPPRWPMALFGSFLSLAALTRPIGVLLFGPALLWIAYTGRRLGWGVRATTHAMGYALLPWVLVVGGWQIRNGLTTERFEVSHGPAKFLLLSRGADIMAQRDGISPPEARSQLLRRIGEQHRERGALVEDLYWENAWGLIRAHPYLFLRTQWRWLPELMFGTGAAGLIEALSLAPASSGGDGRPPRDIAAIFRSYDSGAAILFALCAAQLLVVYVAVGANMLFAGIGGESRGRGAAMALFGILIVYFVLVSAGPQTYSRFRVPMMPLLVLCAASGFERWRSAASVRLGGSSGSIPR